MQHEILRDVYYPRLIGNYWGDTPITQGWRYMMRRRACEETSLQNMLVSPFYSSDKQVIRKKLCQEELLVYIAAKKAKRNTERRSLALCLLRTNIPIDVVNLILVNTTYRKYKLLKKMKKQSFNKE